MVKLTRGSLVEQLIFKLDVLLWWKKRWISNFEKGKKKSLFWHSIVGHHHCARDTSKLIGGPNQLDGLHQWSGIVHPQGSSLSEINCGGCYERRNALDLGRRGTLMADEGITMLWWLKIIKLHSKGWFHCQWHDLVSISNRTVPGPLPFEVFLTIIQGGSQPCLGKIYILWSG